MSQNTSGHTLGRRRLLQLAGGVTAGAGAMALTGGTLVLGAGAAQAADGAFVHPGMLHTQADFDRMAVKVRAASSPWKPGFDKLAANAHAQSSWKANPQATVYRGTGTPENYATLYEDIHAAYQNALRWKITGDTAHADTARDILNAWSGKLTKVTGTADAFIAAGIYGYQFANAAEVMRGYPGFDLDRFKSMMLTVFYPLNTAFLTKHNNAFITNYWGSWDLLSVASVLAIGILCDDRAKVDEAVTYFKSGAGNGSIKHLIPVVHPGGLGQWIEVGRDQGHSLLGVGLAGDICEMAWNQGIDLYGYDDSLFLKGAEYMAKWNLGQDVPYTSYTWKYGAPGVWSGQQTLTAASTDSRGQARPVWEMLYNHYVNRRGLAAPYVSAIAAKGRPEGGGGDYGSGGGYDSLGFGTLSYTRERVAVVASGGSTGTGPATSAPAAASASATAASSEATATAPAVVPSASGAPSVPATGRALASTGTADSIGYAAGAGVIAVAVGGVLALRGRRSRNSHRA
nr:alginate lyase family protein [Streptomyces sp. 846.5]